MSNDVNTVVVNLVGRIDSNNANDVEKDILLKLEQMKMVLILTK